MECVGCNTSTTLQNLVWCSNSPIGWIRVRKVSPVNSLPNMWTEFITARFMQDRTEVQWMLVEHPDAHTVMTRTVLFVSVSLRGCWPACRLVKDYTCPLWF